MPTGALAILTAPLLVAAALLAAGFDIIPKAALTGAAGWTVALVLRSPVALVGKRLGVNGPSSQAIVVGASGPIEEGIRLICLLILGCSVQNAVSLGFGWATIEVIYTFMAALAIARARRITTVPRGETQRRPADPLGAAWATLERLWASGLHIGFSLAIAAHPLLVFAAAAAHSATNLVVWHALRRNRPIAAIEIIGAVWSAVVLLVTLSLWR